MFGLRRLSISSRLVLLILVAALPVFILLLWSAFDNRATVREQAESQLLRSARLLAARQTQFFLNGRDILGSAIVMAEQVGFANGTCSDLLASIAEANVTYVGLAIANPQGTIVCSSDPQAVGTTSEQSPLFGTAAAAGDFVIGRPENNAIPLVYAPRKNGAEPALIGIAALDLRSLSSTMALSNLPDGGIGVIFDSNRTVLARVPTGVTIDEAVFAPVQPTVAESLGGAGIVEATTVGGEASLWAVADLFAEQGLYVAVGIGLDELLADTDRTIWQSIGILTAVFLAAALAAWIIGQLAIRVPLDRLNRSVSRVRAGDYSFRHDAISSALEFRRLEDNFNAMANSLETHETELQQRNARLKDLIDEKEMLVREMNHRIKNSLQLVSSVIGLQQQGVSDPDAKARLVDARARVAAVAKVHERLYGGARLDVVDAGRYLKELCDELGRTMELPDGRSPTLSVRVVDVHLSPDKMIPIGMITTELVTNAIKHSAGHSAKAAVEVILEPVDDQLKLSIIDNGPGFPKDAKPDQSGGLGMRVATALASQLGSKLEIGRADGLTVISLTFSAVNGASGGSNTTSQA